MVSWSSAQFCRESFTLWWRQSCIVYSRYKTKVFFVFPPWIPFKISWPLNYSELAYGSFSSDPGLNTSQLQIPPQHFIRVWYPSTLLGGEMHCESKVSINFFPRRQHKWLDPASIVHLPLDHHLSHHFYRPEASTLIIVLVNTKNCGLWGQEWSHTENTITPAHSHLLWRLII